MKRLADYVSLLLDWNTKVNLISRRGTIDIWLDHMLHSLAPLFLFDVRQNLSVLDLGTGGGLPGIPMSIARPDLHIVLVDSIGKKAVAVQDMITRLPLPNATVLLTRAEELPRMGYARKFDLVLARAVAPLVDILKWSKPLLSQPVHDQAVGSARTSRELPTPCVLAYKGGDLSKELSAAKRKFPHVNIWTREISFPGSEEIDLQGKKLVAATFSRLD